MVAAILVLIRTSSGAEPVDPTALGASVAAMEALAGRAVPPDAAAAVIDLETNCPYHRAAFVVLSTLDRELAGLDASRLSPDERAAFDQLARGVSAQAALARTLGAEELPLPIPGDYLFGDYVHGRDVYLDGAALAASADPIADAEALLATVPARVAAMPPSTVRRVEADWRALGPTVDRAQWFGALDTWVTTFHALAPALARGASAERAARLDHLLALHAGGGC